LHRFNLFYRDTIYNNASGIETKGSIAEKLFNHFVIATHIYLGEHIEAIVGFNALRRMELKIDGMNGLIGLSAGIRARFNKIHINLAHSTYQKGLSYNQLGINVYLNNLIGLSKE
jgi:hypothetical protein